MTEMIEKAFLEGYATADLTINTIFLCVGFTALIALYVCFVYKLINKNTFFDRGFHLSLFGLAVITSVVILTIQSNVVVSLGMVGALSIVRFRTAIKNPMDLVFLFWSISIGIVCGAGFAMIAVVGSVVVTIGILIFNLKPFQKESLVLVVNCTAAAEQPIMQAVTELCSYWNMRARTLTGTGANYVIELSTKQPEQLVQQLSALPQISSVSLLQHDGDITA